MFGPTIYIDVVLAIATLFLLVLFHFKRCYKYWEKKGLQSIEPTFPFGNVKGPLDMTEPEFKEIDRCYEEFRKRGLKHGGIYSLSKPVYMPIDPEYIKNVVINDFHIFYKTNYVNEKIDPVGAHLLALNGQRWKNLRVKLTPVFTSGKMKSMFATMLHCGKQMIDAVEKMNEIGKVLNIKEVMARYTSNVIGSCAFGIDCNCFGETEPEFLHVTSKSLYVSRLRRFLRLLSENYPGMARSLNLPHVPRIVSNFYMKLARECVEYRKKNNISRNDILHILMNIHQEFKETENEIENAQKPMTIGEIAANYFLFFIAGFETSSTTMSFLLYEISQNQDIQNKIRNEIQTVLAKHGGQVTYESLIEMKYIRQAFNETLRKYPVLPLLKRRTTIDYQIPGTNVVLEKGTVACISVNGVHRNPDFFPEPDKFDPERFSDENKGSIKAGTFLGFGEGPRICIGKRFGIMQMSIALAKLLPLYRITLNPDTKVPLEMEPTSVPQTPKGGVWVNLEKL